MFVEMYKNGDKTVQEKNAEEYLIKVLLQEKRINDDKTTTLSGLNMESGLNNIVPSMFYTFQYMDTEMVELGGTKFIDAVPMILCTSVKDGNVSGINFNLLPNDIRASVLDIIYNAFPTFYTKTIFEGDRNIPVINNPFAGMLVTNLSLKNFLILLSSKTGVNISTAVRTYSMSKMSNIRLIEYDQWHHIPFLSFKDAVRGANLANIQTEVIKQKTDK